MSFRSTFTIYFLLFSIGLFGQSEGDDVLSVEADSVTISAARILGPSKILPIAYTIVEKNNGAGQNISLKEYLKDQPGLFTQSSINYAQDLRISMRGFGARSAFGIRGIKLIVDGVPESTPDGQGQVDNINLNTIENIEILSGLSAGLYGNASGGVIRINTQKEVEGNFLEMNHSLGSFGTHNHNFISGLRINSSSLILNGNYFKTKGYREHSKSNSYAFGTSFYHPISEKSNLRFILNYTHSPEALDAGGVTFENYTNDKKHARDRNIDFNAGESINHFKTAVFLNHKSKNRIFKTSLFYHNRNFEGRLPFTNGGFVKLDRQFIGTSSSFQINTNLSRFKNHLVVGTDLHFQDDFRQRFLNIQGTPTAQTLMQNEQFTNAGVYLINNLITKHLNFNLDLRFDRNLIVLEDHFKADQDQSSDITYNAFNFALGMSFINNKNITPFIRISSNFETPTLSELSANPAGLGFNEELKANRSNSIEGGIRGRWLQKYAMSANVFYITSSDEILPFELQEFPERDFFRNLGKTARFGIESHAKWKDHKQNQLGITYAYSRFRFKEYELQNVQLEGNILPGIPQHTVALNVTQHLTQNFQCNLNANYTGSLFANNENSVQVNDFWIASFRCQYSIQFQDTHRLQLYGGINNIFNVNYFDNIRLNAFGNRYYEGGAERNYYLGLRLRFEAKDQHLYNS